MPPRLRFQQRGPNNQNQFSSIFRNKAGQPNIFTKSQQLFNRIKFRFIRRKSFQIYTPTEALVQLSCGRAMRHPANDNGDKPFGKMYRNRTDKLPDSDRRTIMQKVSLCCLFCLILLLMLSSLPSPFGCHLLNSPDCRKKTEIAQASINNGPYSIEVIRKSDGTSEYSWDIDSRIEQAQSCRVKYHDLWRTACFTVVEGHIGNSLKSYPIILDTSASQAIFVTQSHVRQNNLSVYPVKAGQLNGYSCWLCHLPELRIGDIKLIDWPSFYLNPNQFISLDILSFRKKEAVIVGLPLLRKFKYIQFDNVSQEVEFSLDKSFQPHKRQIWQQYPLSIEEDFHGNTFLFVEIPVNGQLLRLQVDTGSGKGLSLSRRIWQKVRQNFQPVKFSKATDIYPYIGTLSCSKAIVPKLEIGSNIVESAEVSIFPDDNPLLEEDSGLLGMQYFKNTIFVLDFENNLLWLKNTGSRLNLSSGAFGEFLFIADSVRQAHHLSEYFKQ